ncbi:MAG: GntR family transcriptional regulator [Tepidisphaeraceae bacterium]
MQIDATSSQPVFRQIVDRLAGAIAAGVYRPGELIPSVRQQSLVILVNPNTVQRAYEALEQAGLIESRKGVGMIVTADAPTLAVKQAMAGIGEQLGRVVEQAAASGLARDAVDAQYQSAWDRLPRPAGNKRGKP